MRHPEKQHPQSITGLCPEQAERARVIARTPNCRRGGNRVLDLRLRMVSFDQCFRSARVGQAAARPLSVSGSARVGQAAARPLSEDGGVSEDTSAARADVSPGDKIAGYRLE